MTRLDKLVAYGIAAIVSALFVALVADFHERDALTDSGQAVTRFDVIITGGNPRLLHAIEKARQDAWFARRTAD